MRYTTILFDLDHTLFDFDASEAAAFASTLEKAGISSPNGHYETFAAINVELWAEVELGELTPNEVRTLRFEQLLERTAINADSAVMADDYVYGLGTFGNLFPGARDLLEALSPVATLALVSNGIGEVQRARIARLGLERYFDAIVISGEVGTAKPGIDIFHIVFEGLHHPDRATTLMIGDSLTSDIAGGINYGIDTCWYTPGGATDATTRATYRISSLDEIPPIVTGR